MNTRQQDIVTLVERHGEITIKELATRLKVTEMTIHRDLDYLQEQRLLYKKRGAAVYAETDVSRCVDFYAEQKRAIGKTAASLLSAGQSVIFDNSTTAAECAKQLDGDLRLTCYTTNLEIAQILGKRGGHVVYCSGGYYFPDSNGFVGAHAESFVQSVRADVAIVGASGISIEHGITNPYPMHNTLQRAILQSAKRSILVADHSKFDRVAMEKTCELTDIDTVVTDDAILSDVLETYQKHLHIVVAKGRGL